MTGEKPVPGYRTLGQRFLDWSKINPVRLVLWLAAITIVSFVIGFGILAVTEGVPSASVKDFSPFRSSGNTVPGTTTVALDGAGSGTVKVTLGAGKLFVDGGAPAGSLMKATFFSKAPEWQPDLTKSMNGSVLHVSMIEKGHRAKEWFAVDSPNRWEIHMNEDIPLNLTLDVGAGESRIALGMLNLNTLSVNTGAGDAWIDLSGYHGNRFDASIHNGIGDLTLRVPKNSSTKIIVQSEIGDIIDSGLIHENGSFITPGYNPALPVNSIRIQQGVGSISLEAV
jgi:hypothetical protein